MTLSNELREVRHNPCLMKPVSGFVLLVFCLFSLFTLVLRIPEFVIGVLLAPLLQRTYWFVEFLYPTGAARWGHFFLLKLSAKTKSWSKTASAVKTHSRTIEQRVEVVKGRVYIHPIPQLLDNIGYLVVCCPPQENDKNERVAVAFLVDCGDANAVICQIEAIGDVHYPSYEIELRSVLCTHKHHDHTAGNGDLLMDTNISKTLGDIYGGAVERVPFCNKQVSNGDILELPSVGGNDPNQLIEVEVIAVPGHTRGSVVYALRTKTGVEKSAYVFSGDTMFSGGSGMPFEADNLSPRDANPARKKGNSPIRASAGSNAVERCFAEILVRSLPSESVVTGDDVARRVLVFPGHEYTSELINRQFSSPIQFEESCQWGKLTPSEFFEIASHLFVSIHRRTLPKTGKLLTVPSPLARELVINPHFRNMKKRGQHVVNAIRLWHHHFAKDKIIRDDEEGRDVLDNGGSTFRIRKSYSGRASPVSPGRNARAVTSPKTASTPKTWNLTTEELSRTVFTTLYTSDLDSVIEDLQTQRISPQRAAQRLAKLKGNMDESAIGRRPIPGTLPTDKNIYLGALGLALLGSPPNALTLSDSRMMKMPAPVECSDRLLVSKKRLILVLSGLGLVPDSSKGRDLVSMIDLLWKEAQSYNLIAETGKQNSKLTEKKKHEATLTDPESTESPEAARESDEIELAVVRWTLYGVQMNQPSWFSKICMPCDSKREEAQRLFPPHPAQGSAMRRTQGELVRHDVSTCPICRDSVGCPAAEDGHSPSGANASGDEHYVRTISSDDDMILSGEEDDDTGDGVEMEVLHLLQSHGG